MTPQKKLANKRIKAGVCVRCGINKPTGTSQKCTACNDKQRKLNRDRRERLVASALCGSCGKEPHMEAHADNSTPLCSMCFYKQGSRAYLGTAKRWKELRDKMTEFCPYTGEPLVLGYNAELDHVLPRATHPELSNEITNLEWVSKIANRAKRDMTKVQFIALCKRITENN